MTDTPEDKVLELESFLPYQLSLVANRISQGLFKYYDEKWKLTVAQWRVMAVLGAEERQTAQQIVLKTAMDKTRISRAVKALTEKKMVLKRVSATDKRATDLMLSARGYRVYGDIAERAIAYEAEIYALLKEKQRVQIDRILARFIEQTGPTA